MMIRSFKQATAVLLGGTALLSLHAARAHGHHHHHGGLRALPEDEPDCEGEDCYANPTDFFEAGGRCGTIVSEADIEEEEEKLLQALANSGGRYLQEETITVPVHFHIIFRGDRGRQVTDDQVDVQLAVLNAAFASTPFFFIKASHQYLDNQTWYRARKDSAEEVEMKTALRVGGVQDLNVYVKRGGGLGWATFPFNYLRNGQKLDGVVVRDESLPGGTWPPYNEGDTLVHEVGHWLGLYHTFQGRSCDGPGDFVSDTPVELDFVEGCPAEGEIDTCVGKPQYTGGDNVRNFMSYVDDACMEEFTPGQVERMMLNWSIYRNNAGVVNREENTHNGGPN